MERCSGWPALLLPFLCSKTSLSSRRQGCVVRIKRIGSLSIRKSTRVSDGGKSRSLISLWIYTPGFGAPGSVPVCSPAAPVLSPPGQPDRGGERRALFELLGLPLGQSLEKLLSSLPFSLRASLFSKGSQKFCAFLSIGSCKLSLETSHQIDKLLGWGSGVWIDSTVSDICFPGKGMGWPTVQFAGELGLEAHYVIRCV